MNDEIPNKYVITYTNFLHFEGRILAFRKKELFDITEMPKHIPFNLISRSWIINRKQLTLKKAQELIKHEPIDKDISNLQWYKQEETPHLN